MYLLDTHALLWYFADDPQLSPNARRRILSGAPVFVSSASLWEIAIKKSVGKLDVDISLADIVGECNLQSMPILQISLPHLEVLQGLPFIHKDPFDRLLVAQAKADGLTLITRDTIIPSYGVDVFW